MCLYPKLIKNRKYTANKKNGGNIPPVKDPRTLYVPIGCQQCIECRRKKAREWQVRLQEEIRHRPGGKFITLTFSNEQYAKIAKTTNLDGYDLDNYIATYAVRHFLERWRKKYKRSLRHWLITELGHNGTENVHLHGIIWPKNDQQFNDLTTIWQYGYTWTGKIQRGIKQNYVSAKTVNYITKYTTKIDLQHKFYKPLTLCSPGIGGQYTSRTDAKTNKYNNEKTNETYRTNTGHKIALPIYYRNKIYTDHEREQLWLQKLNQNIRYVLKQPIDISENQNEYFKALLAARDTNKQLGYGNDEKNWKRKEYEHQIRIIKQLARIQPPAGQFKRNMDL
jgi:hypothetical protein